MPDVEELFRPRSMTLRTLFSGEAAFAIPPYQRAYRWPPRHLRRLLEDAIHALERLGNDPEAVVFVGATITVTGGSDAHRDPPSGTRTVIDGQQRLTTLAMAAALLHEQTREVLAGLRDLPLEDPELATQVEWIDEQLTVTQAELFNVLFVVNPAGQAGLGKLPRIIREGVDRWSTKGDSVMYQSPIAHLLSTYVAAADANQLFLHAKPVVQMLPERYGSTDEDHALIIRRFAQLRANMSDIVAGRRRTDFTDTVDLTELLRPQSQVLRGLFPNTPQRGQRTAALRVYAAHERVAPALRLLLFAKFLLGHVALTQINARDEKYAFDLFDSLNTTGEPLTAFETFVPLVVQKAGLDSDAYRDVSAVAKLLGHAKDNLQTETSHLMVSALLAELGQKVSASHNDQRRVLDPWFKNAPESQQRMITLQMSNTALAYFGALKRGRVDLLPGQSPVVLSAESQFALRFLDAIGHTVTVAPISRYLAAWRDDESDTALQHLDGAIKAMTAFSALWRAAHGGADGIDDRYRVLMRDGLAAPAGLCGPLARTSSDYVSRGVPHVDHLAAALRAASASAGDRSFTGKNSWIDLVVSAPIYGQVRLARFLLMIGNHRAASESVDGLLVTGPARDDTEMLRPERWADERLMTVEHIAPQEPDDPTGWDASLYVSQSTLDQIGNLTLSPLDENIRLSNRSWLEKRLIYKILSSGGPREVQGALDEAAAAGVVLSSTVKNALVQRARHLPLMQAIGRFEGPWDASAVELRSRNLLGRCWDVLDSWL